MLSQHFQRLARYNTLANRRLYETCSRLSDTELKRARPAFFKSIHRTLNHIMVGDRIWLTRFEGGEAFSLERSQVPTTLLRTTTAVIPPGSKGKTSKRISNSSSG